MTSDEARKVIGAVIDHLQSRADEHKRALRKVALEGDDLWMWSELGSLRLIEAVDRVRPLLGRMPLSVIQEAVLTKGPR